MRSTARIGAFCFRPVCIAGALVLAMPSSADGEDSPEEQHKKAIEALGREALKNRQTISQYGFADTVSVFPIEELSKELVVKAGEVSLLPDPKDRGSGKIAVYLLNATDQPLPGAIAFRLDCFLEVKEGGRWRACESFIPGCGTGMHFPSALKPRHGMVFTATDPAIGDMTGELRYCVAISGLRPIISAPFQGRFSSKRFEEANMPGGKAGWGIQRGLDGGGWSDPKDGAHGSVARFPEEWIAAAELDRCYDESLLTRTALIRWKANTVSGEDMEKCRAAADRLSKQPWDHYLDAASLFDRCFAAVTTTSGKDTEFGSPENCRPVVWRYLNGFRCSMLESYVNPERWEQWEIIRKSGNPWGVDQKLVATLVQEAVASLDSPAADEREAAGTFLQANWISPEHLPDDRWWSVLEHNVNSARFAAVGALKQRGKQQEVGRWLANHRDSLGSNLRGLWSASIDYRSDFADWELPIALRLLDTSPLEAADMVALRAGLIKEAAGKSLPAELRAPLRRFLEKEAEAKRLIGLPPPNPGESDYTGHRAYDARNREPYCLRRALYALATWQDPADTPLLRSYLAHPAACYSTSGEKVIRCYEVRSAAAELLKERNEKLPEGTVFEEPVN